MTELEKLTGVNLVMKDYLTTAFEVAAWEQRWADAGLEEYFKRVRGQTTRNILFDPESQLATRPKHIEEGQPYKIFVLEPK